MSNKFKKQYTNVVPGRQLCKNGYEEAIKTLKKRQC